MKYFINVQDQIHIALAQKDSCQPKNHNDLF